MQLWIVKSRKFDRKYYRIKPIKKNGTAAEGHNEGKKTEEVKYEKNIGIWQ